MHFEHIGVRFLSAVKKINWLTVLCIGVLLLSLGLFLRHSYQAITYVYPLDIVEGFLLDQVEALAHGKNVYSSDFTQPPFMPVAYPPIFHVLVLPLYLLFGNAYWYGRLLTLIFVLGCSTLIGLITYTLTKKTLPSFIAGVFFLSVPYVVHWSAFFRVDFLGLLLSLGAMYFALRSSLRKNYQIAFIVFLTCLAVFTKQTFLPTTVLALVSIFYGKMGLKKTLCVFGLLMILIASIFLFFNLITGGGFYLHVIVINANMTQNVSILWGVGSELLTKHSYIGVVLILFCLGLLKNDLKKNSAHLFLSCYLVVSVLASLLIVKEGSNVNYLLELSAAVSLIAGYVLAQVEKNTQLHYLAYVLIIIQTLINSSGYFPSFDGLYHTLPIYSEMQVMQEFIQDAPSPVLADGVTAAVLPLVGKDIYIEPFAMKQMALHGLWDEEILLSKIRQHQFSYILLQTYFPEKQLTPEKITGTNIAEMNYLMWWTPQTYETIAGHYQYLSTYGNIMVFAPK